MARVISILFISSFLFFIACEQSSVQSQQEPIPTNESSTGEEFSEEALAKSGKNRFQGKMVIANRASGSISVIDTRKDKVVGTYSLPDNGEPMYVNWSVFNNVVMVGDRANNRIVFFNGDDFSVKGFAPAGNGVFHMFAHIYSNTLWVVNDVDKTISVIDIAAMNKVADIALPKDLTDMGGKPHDVITGPFARYAYVSMLGFSGDNDYVIQYDMKSHNEVGRVAVGKDPHLSLHPRYDRKLFVPTQGSNTVFVINRYSMQVMKEIAVDGAHGAGMAWSGRTFYTTNLPNGGANGLVAIDTKKDRVIGSTDTHTNNLIPVPHNIALTPNGRKLYVTHSGGSSNTVTVYKISKKNRVPKFHKEIEVGFNPFGLGFSASF